LKCSEKPSLLGVEVGVSLLRDLANVVSSPDPFSVPEEFLGDLSYVEFAGTLDPNINQTVVPVAAVDKDSRSISQRHSPRRDHQVKKNPGVWPGPDTGGIRIGTP
jgi:hypothetical protein